MKLIKRSALAALLLLVIWVPAQAQTRWELNRTEAAITRMYRYYLNRYPARAEMLEWLAVIDRTAATPEQVETTLLGSQEFYARCQYNPRVWVSGLFELELRRNPTAAEMQHWLGRLIYHQGDRAKAADEFRADGHPPGGRHSLAAAQLNHSSVIQLRGLR